ncbi:MAG: class I SAM-dependent methyltransferase, partial [Deltaproteobacteria bacterium]|nr:class I SAM-dependent methyltransferase [Deltaproteobacteria bacterium]
ALAEKGLSVWALEAQAGMIQALRDRMASLPEDAAARIHPVQADMANFSIPAPRFDRILIPYNGLYCLLDAARVNDCLRLAYEHLAPGGQLILDAYVTFVTDPDFDPKAEEAEEDAWMTVVTHEGKDIEIIERSNWKPKEQFIEAIYTYRLPLESGHFKEQTCRIPQRYLSETQLREALTQAGFSKQHWYGDFEDSPFDEQSQTMIVVAEKTTTT